MTNPAIPPFIAAGYSGTDLGASPISPTEPLHERGGDAYGRHPDAVSWNDRRTAVYNVAHSTSTSSVFDYTVATGQNVSALAVTGVNLNGATIQDANSNNADLSGASQ